MEREEWMRLLFPSRALYRCAKCGHFSLLTLRQIIEALELRRDSGFTATPSPSNPANSEKAGGSLLSNGEAGSEQMIG
jgi:hypothetical protein